MRIRRTWVVSVLLVSALLVLCVGVAVADQHSGTWKMDPAKSKFSPGPAQKSLTLKIEADDKGIKVDGEGVNGDDSPLHVQYEAKFDGKDYPANGLPSGADTVAVKRVNADTIVSTQKKAGKVIMTVTSKISADGKTRTSEFKGTDTQGHAVHNVVVFDKQ